MTNDKEPRTRSNVMRIIPLIVVVMVLHEAGAQEMKPENVLAAYKLEEGIIYRAAEKDSGWEATLPLRETVKLLVWNPYQPDVVIAVGRDALYVSSRGGLVWSVRLLLPAGFEPTTLAISIQDPNYVFLLGIRTLLDGTSREVGWRSVDGSMTWDPILDMQRARAHVAESAKFFYGISNETIQRKEEQR
jgi:hypothetical protein